VTRRNLNDYNLPFSDPPSAQRRQLEDKLERELGDMCDKLEAMGDKAPAAEVAEQVILDELLEAVARMRKKLL